MLKKQLNYIQMKTTTNHTANKAAALFISVLITLITIAFIFLPKN